MVTSDRCSASRLLAYVAQRYASVEPSPAIEAVFRSRLLDFAANVVGGAASRASRTLDAHVARYPGSVPVPVGRTASEPAALALAVAAHSLECDDTHQPSSSHPGSVVFPTALALGTELDLPLDRIVRAVIAGYEVMCRLGEIAGPADQYRRGFHPTGTVGVFGAAATAGVLLGLDAGELEAAVALAASCSSGSISFLEGGGWSKLVNAGHAASSGILVARLAAAGFEGPAEAVAGPNGFLAGHADAQRLELLDEERTELAIERTSVKAHGCCRYEQGPIDAILALQRNHRFAAADVASVRVGMLAGGWGIVAEPLEAKRRPTSIVESQFSMPFGAALALVRGRASALDHNEANLADPEILRVCDLVECYRDPGLDAVYPRRWPADVRIGLRDGRKLELRVDYPKGDPENPFDDAGLLDKLWTLAPEAGATDVASLRSLVLDDELTNVSASRVMETFQPLWQAVRTRPLTEVVS